MRPNSTGSRVTAAQLAGRLQAVAMRWSSPGQASNAMTGSMTLPMEAAGQIVLSPPTAEMALKMGLNVATSATKIHRRVLSLLEVVSRTADWARIVGTA